jgi:hypothetical protein
MLIKVFQKLFTPIQLLTFYLLLWNYLLILKMLAETLLRIPFSVIGWCSLVPTSHWLQGKWARINLSLAAFSIILLNHRWLPVSIFSVKIAAFGSKKGVTGRIFKNSKQFQRSKKALWFWFFHSSKKQKIIKLSAHVQKVHFYHNKP